MKSRFNPALVEYLAENSKEYSRYELDLTLLKKGYSGSEIEAAWANLAQVAPTPKRRNKKLYYSGLILSLIGYVASMFFDSAILPLYDHLSNPKINKLNIKPKIEWDPAPTIKITDIGLENCVILMISLLIFILLLAKFPVVMGALQAIIVGYLLLSFFIGEGLTTHIQEHEYLIHKTISFLILTIASFPVILSYNRGSSSNGT